MCCINYSLPSETPISRRHRGIFIVGVGVGVGILTKFHEDRLFSGGNDFPLVFHNAVVGAIIHGRESVGGYFYTPYRKCVI